MIAWRKPWVSVGFLSKGFESSPTKHHLFPPRLEKPIEKVSFFMGRKSNLILPKLAQTLWWVGKKFWGCHSHEAPLKSRHKTKMRPKKTRRTSDWPTYAQKPPKTPPPPKIPLPSFFRKKDALWNQWIQCGIFSGRIRPSHYPPAN